MREYVIPVDEVYLPFPLRVKRFNTEANRIWNSAYDKSLTAVRAAESATLRMRTRLGTCHRDLFLSQLYGHHVSSNEIISSSTWITDEPDTVFPHQYGYHVTSDLALEELSVGRSLHPPFLHYSGRIMTHRGRSLHPTDILLDAFMRNGLSNKRNYMWMSPYIDMEQYSLENGICQTDVDERMLGLLYDSENGAMSPLLSAVLKHIRLGQPITRPELREYRDTLLSHLTYMQGIRGAWRRIIYDILNNPQAHPVTDIESRLSNSSWMYLELFMRQEPARAVVLEVDMAKAFEAMNGLALLDLSGRDPLYIQNLPQIHPDWVNAVYTEQPAALQGNSSFPLKALETLPEEKFLGGVRRRDRADIDPSNPLCDTRYGKRDVQEVWRQLLLNGKIAPLKGSKYWKPEQLSQLFGDELYIDDVKSHEWERYRTVILEELARRHVMSGVCS